MILLLWSNLGVILCLGHTPFGLFAKPSALAFTPITLLGLEPFLYTYQRPPFLFPPLLNHFSSTHSSRVPKNTKAAKASRQFMFISVSFLLIHRNKDRPCPPFSAQLSLPGPGLLLCYFSPLTSCNLHPVISNISLLQISYLFCLFLF